MANKDAEGVKDIIKDIFVFSHVNYLKFDTIDPPMFKDLRSMDVSIGRKYHWLTLARRSPDTCWTCLNGQMRAQFFKINIFVQTHSVRSMTCWKHLCSDCIRLIIFVVFPLT